MGLNFSTRAFINITINLSKPGKKRIITNKIFLIIFIIYISSVYIDVGLHISQNDDEAVYYYTYGNYGIYSYNGWFKQIRRL